MDLPLYQKYCKILFIVNNLHFKIIINLIYKTRMIFVSVISSVSQRKSSTYKIFITNFKRPTIFFRYSFSFLRTLPDVFCYSNMCFIISVLGIGGIFSMKQLEIFDSLAALSKIVHLII